MTISFDELLKQVAAQGGSLDRLSALAVSLQPAAVTAALRRCAVVPAFDRTLYERFLRGGEDGAPSFEAVRERAEVELVPEREGFFRLRESARQDFWKSWWQPGPSGPALDPGRPPEALAALSRELADHYRQTAPDSPDLLRQAIIGRPAEAALLFDKLYKAADTDFDLAGCHVLVDLLGERSTLLSPELQSRLVDRRLYLQARGRWIGDFYATARYYQRAALLREASLWMASPDQWILHLFARGGLGKTVFTRWFVARFCVPEPCRFPCARIDFDFFSVSLITQHPWLLFLKIASQINLQMPDAPFTELLRDYQACFQVLERQETLRQRTTAGEFQETPLPADGGSVARGVAEAFVRVLADTMPSSPVIVVLDTLEEVVLSQEHELLLLLRQLAAVRARCPGFRLILSGRYDLRERLEGFRQEFGEKCWTLEVKGFSPEEGRGYLRVKRMLTDAALIDAIVRRGGGNPFKLALFADIVRANPALTAADVDGYPDDVELAYLIERVVERIPDNLVQWVLRYGALARQLTFTFFKEVMWGTMVEALRGDRTVDDPHAELGETLRGRQTVWQADPAAPAEDDGRFTRAWEQLGRYASDYSWVSEGDTPDTLVFHPDVTTPLRRALEGRTVFTRLHRAAVAYSERRAAEEPARWGEWMRDAVYHRFQLEGEAAGEYWLKVMGRTETRDNAWWRLHLAGEAVSPALLDDEGAPRRRRDGRMCVDMFTMVVAYYALARADVDVARQTPADLQPPFWNEAMRSITKARAYEPRLEASPLNAEERGLLEAAVLVGLGRHAEARAVLRPLVYAAGPPSLRLLRAYADVVKQCADLQEALSLYKQAEALAERTGEREARAGTTLELSRLSHQLGDDAAAQAFGAQALELAEATKARGAAVLNSIEADLRLGQPARALAAVVTAEISDGPPFAGSDRDAFAVLKARALLGVRQPVAAREVSSCVFDRERRSSEAGNAILPPLRPGVRPERQAGLLTQYARAAAELYEHQEAALAIELARKAWTNAGDVTRARRCAAQQARFLMDGVGKYQAALAHLRLLYREDPAVAGLPYAEGLYRDGQTDEMRTVLGYMEGRMAQEPPYVRAQTALLGVLATADGQDDVAGIFAARMAEIEPLSLRLALTAPLRHSPAWRLSDRVRTDVAALFPSPDHADPDFAGLAMRAAEVRRVLGDPDEAARLLDAADGRFREENNLFVQREWLLARDRLDHLASVPANNEAARVRAFTGEYGKYFPLCQAALVEQATRLALRGDLDAARKILEESRVEASVPGDTSRTTAQYLICRGIVEDGLGSGPPGEWLRKAREMYLAPGDAGAVEYLEKVRGVGQSPHPPVSDPAPQDFVPSAPASLIYRHEAASGREVMGLSTHGLAVALLLRGRAVVLDSATFADRLTVSATGTDRVELSADHLLAGGAGGVSLYGLDRDRSRWNVTTDPAADMALSPDGKWLAAASGDTVTVWDAAGHRRLKRLQQPGGIERVIFTRDGSALWTQSGLRRLHRWPLPALSDPLLVEFGELIRDCALDPEGNLLAVMTADELTLLETAGGLRRSVLRVPGISAFAFRPDGGQIATGSDGRDGTPSVRVWDRLDGREIARFPLPDAGGPEVTALAFSPDGGRLFAGTAGNGEMAVWEVRSQQTLLRFRQGGPVRDAAFLPDGCTVVARGKESACFWNVGTVSTRPLDIAVQTNRETGHRVAASVRGDAPETRALDGVPVLPPPNVPYPDPALVEAMRTDWKALARQLGSSLPDTAAEVARLHGARYECRNARLGIDHPLVGGLPWEWMWPAAADEPCGLWRALHHFARVTQAPPSPVQAAAPASNVVIVKPGRDREAGSFRGHSSEGRAIEQDYEFAGLRPSVINDPHPSELPARLSAYRDVSVLHLCVGMTYSPSAGACIDFGGSSPFAGTTAGGAAMSPSEFMTCFGSLLERRPLVVLDVANPSSVSESLRHLLLRNAFAASLQQINAAGTVLGVGLGSGYRQSLQSRCLADCLAKGEEIGGVAASIRQLYRQFRPDGVPADENAYELTNVLPFLSTALFTDDPARRFVPPPTSR